MEYTHTQTHTHTGIYMAWSGGKRKEDTRKWNI